MTEDPVDTTTAGDARSPARWASRKLWLCLLLLITATGLLWAGRIGEASWLATASTVAWAYIAGNVGQTAADGLAKVLSAVTGRANV